MPERPIEREHNPTVVETEPVYMENDQKEKTPEKVKEQTPQNLQEKVEEEDNYSEDADQVGEVPQAAINARERSPIQSRQGGSRSPLNQKSPENKNNEGGFDLPADDDSDN